MTTQPEENGVIGFRRDDAGALVSYDGTLTVSRETFETAADHIFRNYIRQGIWHEAAAEVQFVWSKAALAVGLGGTPRDIPEWDDNDNFQVAAEIFRETLNTLLREHRASLS